MSKSFEVGLFSSATESTETETRSSRRQKLIDYFSSRTGEEQDLAAKLETDIDKRYELEGLLEIQDFEKVIPAINQLISEAFPLSGEDYLTFKRALERKQALQTLAAYAKTIEKRKPELIQVSHWLANNNILDRVHFKKRSSYLSRCDVLAVAAQVIQDEEVYQKYQDKAQRQRCATFAQYFSSVSFLTAGINDFFSISDRDIEILPEYVKANSYGRTKRAREYEPELAEIQYCSRHEQAMRDGYEKVKDDTDIEAVCLWDANNARFDNIDNDSVGQIKTELQACASFFGSSAITIEAMVLIHEDLERFRELVQTFEEHVNGRISMGEMVEILPYAPQFCHAVRLYTESFGTKVYSEIISNQDNRTHYMALATMGDGLLKEMAGRAKKSHDLLRARRSGRRHDIYFNNFMCDIVDLGSISEQARPVLEVLDRAYPEGWILPAYYNMKSLLKIQCLPRYAEFISFMPKGPDFLFNGIDNNLLFFLQNGGLEILQRSDVQEVVEQNLNGNQNLKIVLEMIASGKISVSANKLDQVIRLFLENNKEDSTLLKMWHTRKLKLTVSQLDRAFRIYMENNNDLTEVANWVQSKKVEKTLGEENWHRLLGGFLCVKAELISEGLDEEEVYLKKFPQTDRLNGDLCYKELQKRYQRMLEDGSADSLTEDDVILLNIMQRTKGTSHLKFVESLGGFMSQLTQMLDKPTTFDLTKEKISTGLTRQEEIFKKNRWADTEKANLYNMSSDLIEAAPSLYSSFLDLFHDLSAKEFKRFVKENMPLYHALLAVYQQNGEQTYNSEDLITIRARIRDIKKKLSEVSNPAARFAVIEDSKEKCIEDLQKRFQEKFKLIKVPEQWDPEKIRLMQNFVRYLGNIANRNRDKELKISLFLGLGINNQWQAFREGKDFNVTEYFESPIAEQIQGYMDQRKNRDTVTAEILGIKPDEMSGFQVALQEEVIISRLGDVQTIDVKLGNLIRNLEDLSDPDVYPEQRHKDMLDLLKKNRKMVGRVLAKTFQIAKGRKMKLSAEEEVFKGQITKVYGVSEWTTDKVQEIQNEIKPISVAVSVLEKISSNRVAQEIQALVEILKPTDRIIQIFNKLGEDFKSNSGAIALSQDLSYLENIIIKERGNLEDCEKAEIQAYLDKIRCQMIVLEELYDDFTGQITQIQESMRSEEQQILAGRLEEIKRIMKTPENQTMLIGRMTSDWNEIIENIRACLGCLHSETNNDTNLTFGDNNKFFLFTRSEKQKGSNSDELVYFFPIKHSDGSKEMSFVMDMIYGSKTSDILFTHLEAINNKYRKIKNLFPDCKVSIFVTTQSLRSVGMSPEIFMDRVAKEDYNYRAEEVKSSVVTVPKSASGDHYTEFAGWGGESGDKQVSGVILRL